MGLIKRTIRVIRAKFNKVLSSAENPVEQLEMTYQDMREERRSMKQSIVNVKAQRKSLERKIDRFEDEIDEHNQQARAAMKQDEEDLARTALEQKKAKMRAVEDLEEQVENIHDVEDEMYDKLDEIDDRISELKTEKEVLKARYESAEAMNSVNESMTEGMGEYSVEDNIEDIKTDINEMQSKAEAVQEFEDEREDEKVEEQLEQMTTDSEVESEMETLRAEFNEDSVAVGTEDTEDELEQELA